MELVVVPKADIVAKRIKIHGSQSVLIKFFPCQIQVLFGTMDGQIIVLSSTGTMITQVVVLQGSEIISLTWSCEKFNMDESSAEQNENFTAPTGKSLSV